MRKTWICAVMCALVLNVSSFSQESLSRTEVVIPAAISASCIGLKILCDGLFYASDFGVAGDYILLGLNYGAILPVYPVAIPKGLFLTGAALGFSFGNEGLRKKNAEFFRAFVANGTFQTALYSTYVAYKDNRVKAAPGVFPDWRKDSLGAMLSGIFPDTAVGTTWKPYHFWELMISPYLPENLSDPFVFLLPVAGTVSTIMQNSQNQSRAIWNTGKAYIGSMEAPAYAAVPIMALFFLLETSLIGTVEEAHFRGFLYEEMGSSLGDIAAKGFDCLYFPAIHIPTDAFVAGYGAGDIALNFLRRAVLTFYLDTLYDRGGLGRTVAAHMWIDAPILFINWLFRAGVPQTGVESILALLPEINLSYTVRY